MRRRKRKIRKRQRKKRHCVYMLIGGFISVIDTGPIHS